MNQDIIQGKWTQLKGSLKKQWGKLTDDDLRRGLQVPAVGGGPVRGQADDPVTEHGALPGWAGVD